MLTSLKSECLISQVEMNPKINDILDSLRYEFGTEVMYSAEA